MSETPQQHGWQSPDLNDPADDAARQQRGFGVFEAPSVPDDFPAFTPYSTLRADEFPPDSEQPTAFPGFPSEEASSYVPAPAVVPIPGVQHEAFPSDPALLPPPTPDHLDSGTSGSARSWAAFAAGDGPRQSTSPKPWEELSPFEASLDAAAATTPSYDPPSYETPSWETPSYEPSSSSSSSSYESSSYESSSYEPSSSSSSSSYESPSYQTPSYETPSYESSSYESSSFEPSSSYESSFKTSFDPPADFDPPFEPSYESSFESSFEPSYGRESTLDPEPEPSIPSYELSEPEPVFAPPPPPPATGSVRVAAAVPPGSRVEPNELPDVSSQMPKPVGRVYGSASVGGGAIASGSTGGVYASSGAVYGQPADPSAMPGTPAAMPGSPGTPVSPAAAGSVSMPGSPGAPVSPASMSVPAAGDPSTGMIRATARVSSAAAPSPGEAVPVAKSSTVYGSPAQAAAPAEAPGRTGRQPAFGDLLEPAAPPNIPMQRGPQSPIPAGVQMPGGPPPGIPHNAMQPVPPGQFGQPGQSGQLVQPVPPGQLAHPGQQPPARPITTSAPEPKPERKGRLIIGVLVGCVLLLAVAFGGLLLIDKLVGPPFAVGDCVKQKTDKQEAIPAACTDEGAYKVVSSVGSADECDKEQPYVKVGEEILCLKPATQ